MLKRLYATLQSKDNQQGQGLVEYALILALVSIVSVGVLNAIGTSVSVQLEKTTCELGGSEDCECRVIEDVVVSEYNCTAGNLFVYTALTTCGENTELTLLSESSSGNTEYEMSYNASNSQFEMTNSTTLCSELSSASSPQLHLVSRGTEYSTVRSFALGADGEPITGYGDNSSGDSSSSGSSGGGDTSGGDTSGGDTSGGDTSGGDTSGGDSSGGDTSGGDTSGGDTSGGDTSGGDTSGGDTSGGDTSGGDQSDNNPPVLPSIADETVAENSSTTLTFSATDADGDDITYSSPTVIPTFMVYDTSSDPATLTITPDSDDDGTYSITIVASDDNGGSDSETFDVIVTNVNTAPQFQTINNQSVNEAETLTVNLVATDAEDDDLSYGTSGTIPSFMNVSTSGSPKLIVNPTYGDAGEYPVSLYVTDGEESDTLTFTVTVVATNRDPYIPGVSVDPIDEDSSQTVNITVTDPDDDSVTLSATGTESWMTFTPGTNSATLALAPADGDNGTYTVTVTANDGNGGSDTMDISITVNDSVTEPEEPEPVAAATMEITGSTDNNQQSSFNMRLTNTGTQDLSNLSIRIYFYRDRDNRNKRINANTYVLEKYWDQSGGASITGPSRVNKNVYYYTINFSGTLTVGQSWQFNTAFHLSTWQSYYDSSNDHWRSGGFGNSWSTTTSIPIYLNGTLLFGSEP